MRDERRSLHSPVNLLNAIWTITVNNFLRTKDSIKVHKISEIAYPQKISQEIGKLHLAQLMA